MSLIALDSIVTAIAVAVHQSAPTNDWREAIVTVLIPPDGESRAMSYAYVSSKGNVEETWRPKYEFKDAIGENALAHWKLSQEMGQPRWYGMIIRVSKAGEFRLQFEYNDNYQLGDHFKPRPAPQPSELAGLQ